jgi:hypothetical protein
MKANTKVASVLFACLLFSACATTAPPAYRANPQLNEKLKTAKTIMVIPLGVDVYEISAGGIAEKMDEWTFKAKRNVMTAIQDELQTKPLTFVKPFEETLLSDDQKSNLEETSALFDAVSYSVIIHTYGPPEQRFAEKVKNFDYSLGPEVKEIAGNTDTLLFVKCSDQISTGSRKALQAGSMILGALVGIQVAPAFGVTTIYIALVDAESGSILWYNFHGSRGVHDLRDPVDASTLIKGLLKDFPMK